MKILSTKTHGVIDYVMGIFLIVAPWLFGFARGGAESWIMVILGLGIIAYSLLTDYEYGAIKKISMRGHLWLDGLGGLLLAASPWLFGFAEYVFWPHLILGVAEIIAAFTTETVPAEAQVHTSGHQQMHTDRNAYSRNRTTHTTAEAKSNNINAQANRSQSQGNKASDSSHSPQVSTTTANKPNQKNANNPNAVKNPRMNSNPATSNSRTNADNVANSHTQSKQNRSANQTNPANRPDQTQATNQNLNKESSNERDNIDHPQAQNKPLNNNKIDNSDLKQNPNRNQNQ